MGNRKFWFTVVLLIVLVVIPGLIAGGWVRPPSGVFIGNITGSSNSSDYWDNLGTINTTVLVEQEGGVLGVVINFFDNRFFQKNSTGELNNTHFHSVDNLTELQNLNNSHLHAISNLTDPENLADTHLHNVANLTDVLNLNNTHGHNATNITAGKFPGEKYTIDGTLEVNKTNSTEIHIQSTTLTTWL